jgi:hypothetical protein
VIRILTTGRYGATPAISIRYSLLSLYPRRHCPTLLQSRLSTRISDGALDTAAATVKRHPAPEPLPRGVAKARGLVRAAGMRMSRYLGRVDGR